jgi:DNA-binding response OmpR family regulator
MAKGEELLIAEPVERDREGLRKLFDAEGYVSTACAELAQARDLVTRKFFPAALIDLDFGGTNEGLALRAGVVDIVSKRPDQVDHLRNAVHRAVDRYYAGYKESSLLREVGAVLDDAMKILLAQGRKLQLGGDSSGAGLRMKPAILIIDENQAFLSETANLLAEKEWDVSVELSGGSGLDKASTFSFQIVCVREELGDLPGQMLLRSAQGQRSGSLGLLYSQAGSGHIDRYEGGQAKSTETPFRGAAHLVECMGALVEEVASLREDRRYVQALRSEHGPFLKRFADLKTRIDALSD